MTKLIGSMLSPFCYYKSDTKKWIMLFGLQFIFENNKIKLNIISPTQWTKKIQWFFLKRSHNSGYEAR